MATRVGLARREARLRLGAGLTVALITLSLAGGVPIADAHHSGYSAQSSAARAEVACDFYAKATESNAGYWDGTGSLATPFGSVVKLTNALQPGQTGCLLPGPSFTSWDGAAMCTGSSNGTLTRSSYTLRSLDPEAPATLKGQWHVKGSDVTFQDLRVEGLKCLTDPTGTFLIGQEGSKGTALYVGTRPAGKADRFELLDSEVTNPRGICFSLDYGDDLLVRGNYIHHCGTSATWVADDSGAHGIYLQLGSGATIEDNVIAHNQYRGLQTWPGPTSVTIRRNLFFKNATHINIGSCLPSDIAGPKPVEICQPASGGPYLSQNVIVHDNILAEATFWNVEGAAKNKGQLFGNFTAAYKSPTTAGIDVGNRVYSNCFALTVATTWHAPDGKAVHTSGYGFEAVKADNTTTATLPTFAAAAATSYLAYKLQAGSTCADDGPTALRPRPVAFNGALCTIVGTSGPDVLEGTPGNDVICGLGGNDTIKPGDGFDIIDGGDGVDTLSYSTITGWPVTVNLGNGEAFAPEGVLTFWDRFGRIENATGSPNDDTLIGNGLNNTLIGGAGDDTLIGGAGSDTLYGGAGDDILNGGAGNDTASYAGSVSGVVVTLESSVAQNTGGAGWDTISEVENLTGSSFNDTLIGNGLNNTLIGGAGSDTLRGRAGADSVSGNTGNDILYGGAGNDILNGGDGNDILNGDADKDTLYGGAGIDKLYGGYGGGDKLYGGDGNDALNGGAGINDLCDGGYGTDTASSSCEIKARIP